MFDSCLRLSPNRRLPRLSALCVANLRPACIYVRRSRVLFIWPSRLPAKPPCLHPALFSGRCIEERQRRVFTSLRSHNSGRQTGKPSFLSLSLLFLPFRFPQALFSSTFTCNLGEVLQGSSSNRPSLRASSIMISGWVRERERLDSRFLHPRHCYDLNCRDTSIVARYRSFRSLCNFKIDRYTNEWLFRRHFFSYHAKLMINYTEIIFAI